MLRIAASFLVGMIVGAAILVTIKGIDLDYLYLQTNRLEQENAQLQEEIDSLKKDLIDKQKQSVRRVHKIEIHVMASDEFTKLGITKFVKDRTRTLLDAELTYLESLPQLIPGLIDGRIYSYDNQSYKLHVDMVVIGETLRIWVEGIKSTPGS